MTTIKTKAKARKGDYYIVSCPGYWGRGETIHEAINKLPWSLDRKNWILYSVHPETYIDGAGYFCRPEGTLAPLEIDCANKKRSLFKDKRPAVGNKQ